MKKTIGFLLLMFSTTLFSADWPVYKGNLYFTGNNDEIIVKNNNLKWLFQAGNYVYNPIISDGKVYFSDLDKIVYCLDEELGKLLWKTDLKQYSQQFRSSSRAAAAGKVKYPLIFGNYLYLSDSTAIYCIDKNKGQIIWARVGVQEMDVRNAVIDGIYSDPMISSGNIIYGTRKVFLARNISNGHVSWNNQNIASYGGFPSYYDEIIFTQSKDLRKNKFTVYCLDSKTGREKWSTELDNPLQIFSPVVYQRKVFMATGKKIFSLDLETGRKLWSKEYSEVITSNPSFTDREILFTVGNQKLTSINPENGEITREMDFGFRSSPLFVTIRDQIYVANNINKENTPGVTFASLKAYEFGSNQQLWEFVPPFPGGISQPAANGGVLFLPAGNYLYAVGMYYNAKTVDGGDGNYLNRLPSDKPLKDQEKIETKKIPIQDPVKQKQNLNEPNKPTEKERIKPSQPQTRKVKLSVVDKNSRTVPAYVVIKKEEHGRILFRETVYIDRPKQEILVPAYEDIDLLASADGYAPKKEVLKLTEDDKTIVLDKLEKGESFHVQNIQFEFNKAYLKKESLDILNSIVNQMKKYVSIKLEIRGHTDSVGDKAYNLKLSIQRADAVMEYMIKNGISPERLKSAGFGETKPIATNKTEDGRALNRRTEFYVLDK